MPTILSRNARIDRSPLESYMREINETPLLTGGQEKELAYRIEDGDAPARDHMVRANLRLVVNLARAYLGRGLELQDLIEEGNLGLMRAVEGFDPAMNTRFSTYASFWIRQSMKRALVNSAKTIRIPAYMVELLSKWRRATSRLQEELGHLPSQEEVAHVMNLSQRKLNIIKKTIRIYNISPNLTREDVGSSPGELAMDIRTPAPDMELSRSEDLHAVLAMLGKMDPREATVLRMRFGLEEEAPKTLKEIGECLGLTRERVRQIEKEALKNMRDGLDAA
jgi:RNA polymerase primary sigma factor